MPNTSSAKKRTRQFAKRRLANRYKLVGARNLIKKLLGTADKAAAEKIFPDVESAIDRLAKHNIIHRNKAANQKSRLKLHVNRLGTPAK